MAVVSTGGFESRAEETAGHSGKDGPDQRFEHPLEALVPDPAGLEPLGDESRFVELVRELVSENAPRVFAVVQEYGQRVDARIAAWGIAFEGRAEVVAVEENLRMRVSSPEVAVRLFHLGTRVRARLVWSEPGV
ncbi:hypothetical protein [Actinopolyspora mortivallis]|uniref:hypothetical protein n=1 Tax=Actinopolyspora mortivallis TaxID=33906 RepID=UPI0003A62620|nr:hypothetical protein [Actinopolyspora mortivallis]